MGKKTQELEQQDLNKETIELPKKVGFGNDAWELTEKLDQSVTYAKFGKGSDEVVFLINDIKTKDPQAKISVGDKRLNAEFSRAFEIKTFNAPRKMVEITDRQRGRLEKVREAIIESLDESDEEFIPDDKMEELIAEFPKVVSYRTDDENEEYYIKSKEEIWIQEDAFSGKGYLLAVLFRAYMETKEVNRESKEYIDKFEDVVTFMV